MESAVVSAKGQVVIPQKIRALFQIKSGMRVHPPSPAALLRRIATPAAQRRAPPFSGEEGEARVASERFRPTGVQEGATGLPVGLHFEARHGEIVLTPITPRYFERIAGFLGNPGDNYSIPVEEILVA